jgi:RHS repeat-associated protein
MPTPDKSSPNRVGIRNSTDYSPFGVELDGRTVSVDGYRFGYQGSEKDNEFKGEGNSYTTEFRQLDPRLGRWLTLDPIPHYYQSPFCGFDNNPILFVDPDGTTVNGDYYGKKGNYLGSDGKNDDKVYVVTNVKYKTINVMGKNSLTGKIVVVGTRKVFDYEESNSKKLNVKHSEFAIVANIIKQEGGTSTDAEELLWIAHTSNNAAGKSDMSLYEKLNTGFSTVAKADKTQLSKTSKSNSAIWARAAAIDVYLGGKDPTGGATLWDGTDFLAWGLKSPNGTPQNKFEEYNKITIAKDIYTNYLNAQRSVYGSHVSYNGVKYNLPSAVFIDKANWKTGDFIYRTGAKTSKSLVATGSKGQTIFWKKV